MSRNSNSGYFSDSARTAAISAALPLVATYFQRGGRLADPVPALGVERAEGDPGSQDLLEALQLRVMLASAARLQGIAAEALGRTNFRYAIHREDVFGAIRGRLDLHRLVRETGRLSVPPRYPVLTVSKSFVTPENVLLACAFQSVRKGLGSLLRHRLHARNAERQARDTTIQRIDQTLSGPVLRECRRLARDRVDRGQVGELRAEVERRITAGHVTSPAYRDLLDWVGRDLSGLPTAEPGEIEWSFYGAEFDTRLFEIWLLGQLRQRLMQALGAPDNPWDFFSGEAAIDVHAAGGVRVRLVYQTSLRRLRGGSGILRWTRAPEKPLGEIPDFLIDLEYKGVSKTLVLDAKLRDRDNAPTEEIYKLLGYFNNFSLDAKGLGAILYYAPATKDPAYFKYQSGAGGAVVAFSLDPERPDANQTGWDELMSLVTAALSDVRAGRP